MRYIISLVLAVIIEHFFKKKVQKIVYEILPYDLGYELTIQKKEWIEWI